MFLVENHCAPWAISQFELADLLRKKKKSFDNMKKRSFIIIVSKE